MSLPPERISIKRRRQDEPVDTLVLEPGAAHDKKRRFTDYYFQRVQRGAVADITPGLPSGSTTSKPLASYHAGVTSTARDYTNLGIPAVKISTPGDEVKDFAKYRAAQKDKLQGTKDIDSMRKGPQPSSLLPNDSTTSNLPKSPLPVRRFHLTPDLSSVLRPNPTGGIRRSQMSLRPPLATFIERRITPQITPSSIYKEPPVDRIVELNTSIAASGADIPVTADSISKRTQIGTFRKSASPVVGKSGVSIRDDPTTWDHESDQLANELAALAFEIDPADAAEPPIVVPSTVASNDVPTDKHQVSEDTMILDGDDDFIFETYIRIKHDSNLDLPSVHHNPEIGVLVIDDENEGLWEKYVHSDDDDDEWDEEDEDSNAEDNPRNEYPDDEVSTDDEFGRNVYKYRQNASDDEEFDDSKDEW